MSKTIARTLNDRQKYLLGRVLTRYDVKPYEREPETAEIRKARAVVSRFDKRQAVLACKHDKRMGALMNKVRDVIYFDTEERALRAVQQLEKFRKTCEVTR